MEQKLRYEAYALSNHDIFQLKEAGFINTRIQSVSSHKVSFIFYSTWFPLKETDKDVLVGGPYKL